jgi:hypothetical protein
MAFSDEFNVQLLLVRKLLESPLTLDWSLQGFGMLRLYLSEEVRVHVWDSRFRIPNVSTIHDHPWDFKSVVLCGQLINLRYAEDALPGLPAEDYKKALIKCGAGACVVNNAQECKLRELTREHYLPGDSYTQVAEEVHDTQARDGTITIVTRSFRKSNRDYATLYFKDQWVSAEPRKAKPAEIITIVGNALLKLYGKAA